MQHLCMTMLKSICRYRSSKGQGQWTITRVTVMWAWSKLTSCDITLTNQQSMRKLKQNHGTVNMIMLRLNVGTDRVLVRRSDRRSIRHVDVRIHRHTSDCNQPATHTTQLEEPQCLPQLL